MFKARAAVFGLLLFENPAGSLRPGSTHPALGARETLGPSSRALFPPLVIISR